MEKFVALFDAHWGYEINASRHRVPLHDPKAIKIAMDFIDDFEPDHVILGGDMLDCGAISHHNDRKAGKIEGLRILADARELRETILGPLEESGADLTYIIGNHEDWLNDLVDAQPGLSGIVDPASLLGLDDWRVIQNGEAFKLGKLTFVHGDQLSGEFSAKSGVTAYERNIRFGHFHTYQVYTKTTPIDANGHTGISVPCLCRKAPSYGGGKPNRWVQGFLWGYIGGPAGVFSDYVSVIVNGRSFINGKLYTG